MVIEEKVLINEKNYHAVILGETGVIKLTTKGFIPYNDFVRNAEQVLKEVEKHRIKKVITDNRYCKVLSKEHQEYISGQWVKNFTQKGGVKIAVVMPEDVFGRMGVDAVVQTVHTVHTGDDSTLEMRAFDNMKDTEDWIF